MIAAIAAQQAAVPALMGVAVRQLGSSATRWIGSWATVDVDKWSGTNPAKAQNLGEASFIGPHAGLMQSMLTQMPPHVTP